MRITRRTFLTSMLASGAVAAVIGRGAPRRVVRLSGPVFTREMAAGADQGWLSDCVLHSVWQVDADGFAGRPLVRHPLTGLSYVVSPATGGSVSVRQIAADCCRCREDLDPDYIVGHAARHVAAVAFERFPDWRKDGPAYLRFAYLEAGMEWPDTPTPLIEEAPRIVLTPRVRPDATVA